MSSDWLRPAIILTGICTFAVSSFSQTYTVSAKPGAVNFVQGDVTINGDQVWTSNLKATFLNANDVIAVKNGRAEVLLTPGVFLRLGENSQVRMLKPSLIETQVEAVAGESMIEVDDLVPGSSVVVTDRGSSTTLIKPGLYRFTEKNIAVLEGKADVAVGDRKVELKKNKEAELDDSLLLKKVDLSQGDDLYAWSNQRAQYNAAATYAGSRDVYNSGGYGFSSIDSPGWYWNSPFNSYMWMPGNGAFYSPFGWGFYGPGLVAYAPVISVPSYGYGYGGFGGGFIGITKPHPPVVTVPVNPQRMPASNFQGTSPASLSAARSEMQQVSAFYGLRTASGAAPAFLRSGQTYSSMQAASRAAAASARASSSASSSSFGSGGGGGSVSSSSPRLATSGWSGGGGGASMSHASSGGGRSK